MNKNFLKATITGAVFASLLMLFMPIANAASSSYIAIPLQFSRSAPSMIYGGADCYVALATGKCEVVKSGIGVYHYVKNGSQTPAPTSLSIKNLLVTDTSVDSTKGTDGVLTNYQNFSVNSSELRIYGLTVGHSYRVSFDYDDSNSTDIYNLIQKVDAYCQNPEGAKPKRGDPTEENAFNIVTRLVNGCGVYSTQPFLPASFNMSVPVDGSNINYTKSVVRTSAVTLQAPQPTTTPKTGSGDNSDTCPLADGAPLRWIGCPLIEIGGRTADALQGQIRNFLYTPTGQIFDNEGFQSIAKTFRNLGIALIFIAGLVMVISQASGMEFVDTYTVRKLLPRMIVALIGIVLAMPLLKYTVTFFNDIGIWMSDLLTAAVHTGSTGSTTGLGTDVLQFSFLSVGLLGSLAFLGLGGLLSLIGTVILALFIGFIVLAVRQLVVLITVLLAPLAIAAYVLPGTQKLWEFWKNAFITAMTIFPIIMLFIASGKALSGILGQGGSSEYSLLAIIVYFAPFFLLPFAFKLAGGLMSTVFSIANDRGRGGFDRLKKYRQGKVAQNVESMKHGNRLRGDGRFSRGFNRATAGTYNFATADKGLNPLRWGSAMQSHVSNQSLMHAGEYSEKNEAFQAIKSNDDLLNAALDHKGNYGAMERALIGKGYDKASAAQGVAAIRLARRDTSDEVFETAAAMALPGTGTAFAGGAGEMHNRINEIAGGDRQKASRMLAAMRSGAVQARRFDLGGGSYGSQLMVMNKQFEGTVTTAEANRTIAEQSLASQGGGYVAGARNGSVKNFAPIMLDQVRKATSTGDIQKTAHELAILAGRYDAMGSVSPENADLLGHEVLSKELSYMAPEMVPRLDKGGNVVGQDWTGNYVQKTASVREAIEDWRGQAQFQELRREYQNAALANASAAAAAGIANPPEMGPPMRPS